MLLLLNCQKSFFESFIIFLHDIEKLEQTSSVFPFTFLNINYFLHCNFDEKSWFAVFLHEWKKYLNQLFMSKRSGEHNFFTYSNIRENQRFSSSFSTSCRKITFLCFKSWFGIFFSLVLSLMKKDHKSTFFDKISV